MATKSYRITISFDEKQEQDIIRWLNDLAENRRLGEILSSLVRKAFDENTTSDISAARQQFFEEVDDRLKAQAGKIDEIYSMCEDLYGLVRMNRAMELKNRTDGLMLAHFILQRQQQKLAQALGTGDHLYESERLLREQEKADKVFEYIAEVYGGILNEIKPMLVQKIEIPVEDEPVQKEVPPAAEEDYDFFDDDDDEIIELVQPPPKQTSPVIHEMDAETAAMFLDMMDD